MPEAAAYLGAAAAFALAAVLVPVARRVALAADLVAPVRPDRLHREVRPYGGGLALLAATVLVLAAMALVPRLSDEPLVFDEAAARRLGIGAGLFFVLGLLDDRYAFSGGVKLGLQAAGAAVAVFGLGFQATAWLTAPGLAEVASVLWVLAVVNAYNLLDHADGLAAACGAVMLAALGLGQVLLARELVGTAAGVFVPLPALAAAGALAGFLLYNAPPARLFMGDAGSQFIGFLLAALTMEARYYFPHAATSRWAVLVPVAVLAVPLFDMGCVTVSRLARGRSPLVGDATSHLAHRMLARGVSPRRVVLAAAGAAAVTGAASAGMYRAEGWRLAALWAVVAAVLAALLAARRPARGACA